MQSSEWFLVANAARARLLVRTKNEPLRLVHAFGHVESRMKTSELGDGKRGRQMHDGGFGGAAFEPRSDLHEKERHRFAHELAQFIDHEARSGRFARLSIFAPSPFLGELKQALGAATVQHLAAAEDIDLTHASLVELDARIPQLASH